MPSVSFLYVNIIALCCYVLMFCMLLAAKKTLEIKLFLLMLLASIGWLGGSVLMRVQAAPGLAFWFYVSLISLFCMPVLFHFFVRSFWGGKRQPVSLLWLAGTVVVAALAPTGIFLRPPAAVTSPGEGTVFLYEMGWGILAPVLFFVGILLSTVILLRGYIRESGIRAPGVKLLLIGAVIMIAGNLVQLVPGNTFPWDTLAGIVFAVFLILALYRRHLIQLTFLVSKSVLMAITTIICFIVALSWVGTLEGHMITRFGMGTGAANALVVTLFTLFFGLVYGGLRAIINRAFAFEEQQDQRVKVFSHQVLGLLDASDILERLVAAIDEGVPIRRIYVCLSDGDDFAAAYGSRHPLPTRLRISRKSPIAAHFSKGNPYFVLDDLEGTPAFFPMRQAEPLLFEVLKVRCIVPLKDGDALAGLVLLSDKGKGGRYTNAELGFFDTLTSIASIAMKNAALNEKARYDERIDNHTGIYNFAYFMEKVKEEFEACEGGRLSLLYLDIDDFKLYNQRYGVNEGNGALKILANILKETIGSKGYAFRHSGKVFAALLPQQDCDSALELALAVQEKVKRAIAPRTGTGKMHHLTLSGGISAYPYTAKTPKDLLEQADIEVYNAKNSGKGIINVYRPQMPGASSIADRAMDIVKRSDVVAGRQYKVYSSSILALTAAIDAKDSYTYNHSQNVARYASILATAIGQSDSEIRNIYEAALLHDIGKISIPESILVKTGGLDEDESAVMRSHVDNSIAIIRHLPSMDYLIPTAIGHHERWDGTGYPLGIAGTDIPIAARCLAVADAFDAMTADRPYRRGQSADYAIAELRQNAGKQFDPDLARIFIGLIETGEVVVASPAKGKTEL